MPPRPSGARQLLAAALAEPQVLRAALRAVGGWLRQNKTALLTGDRDTPPHLSRWKRQRVWEDLIEDNLIPAVREVWTNRWQQIRALRNPDAWRTDYLRQVRNRLRDFPAQSFEVVRRELIHGTGRGESIPQLRDRIGRVLGIDAPSRAILDEIMDMQGIADDPNATTSERDFARRRARQLERALPDADKRWHWRAARIARTETIGAFNAGLEAAAEAAEQQYGDRLELQWWATRDTRTRRTHRAAHGQTRRVGEPFHVGDAFLRFPGDPASVHPEEVINCRCVLVTIEDD